MFNRVWKRPPQFLIGVAVLALAVVAVIAASGAGRDGTATVAAQGGSSNVADITLSILDSNNKPVIRLSEADARKDLVLTATRRKPSTSATTVTISLPSNATPLTPGVRLAECGTGKDYTVSGISSCSGTLTITIAANAAAWGTGTISLSLDPQTDNYSAENGADESIMITGTSTGLTVAPAEIILTDGPYLNFGKYTESVLFYRGQTVSQALPTIVSGSNVGAVSYTVSSTSSGAHGLTHTGYTKGGTSPGTLTGTVATTDSRTLYTVTATDADSGASASVTFSVIVIQDQCSTNTAWTATIGGSQNGFNNLTDDQKNELIQNCNVLLAARDQFEAGGTASTVLNWSTSTNIHDWVGVCFEGADKQGVSSNHTNRFRFYHECKDAGDSTKVKTHQNLMFFNMGNIPGAVKGPIPPVLGHLQVDHVALGLEYAAVHFWSVDEQGAPKFYRKTDNNRITGPIPPEFGNLNDSTVLSLGGVNLSRSSDLAHICAVADMDSLTYLYLHRTGMSGSIPACLHEVDKVNFRSLYLNDNNLSGRIPWQLGLMKNARNNLWLQGNNLSGTIPWQLSNLGSGHTSRFRHLNLSYNNLSGPIPWQLANASIEYLYLNDNQLTGGIPPQLTRNSGPFGRPWLQNNWLTGTIPPEIFGSGTNYTAVWGSAFDLRNENDSWEDATEADKTTDTLKPPVRLDGNLLTGSATLAVTSGGSNLTSVGYREQPDGTRSISGTLTVTVDNDTMSVAAYPGGIYPNALTPAASGHILITGLAPIPFSIAKCVANSGNSFRCTQTAKSTTVNFTIPVDDDLYTGDRVITFALGADSYAGAGRDAALSLTSASKNALPTITIEDDDPPARPQAPPSLTLTAGTGSITAEWTASNYGFLIDAYEVQYCWWTWEDVDYCKNVSNWRSSPVSGKVTTATLTGLYSHTHLVKVRARNHVGWSQWSQTVTAKPLAGKLGAPANVTLDARQHKHDNGRLEAWLRVDWDWPAWAGSRVHEWQLRYRYSKDGGAEWSEWEHQHDHADGYSDANIYNLVGQVLYEVQVRGRTDGGWGAWSASAFATTRPGTQESVRAPSDVRFTNVTVSGTTVTVHGSGADTWGYDYRSSRTGEWLSERLPGDCQQVQGFGGSVTYTVTISAPGEYLFEITAPGCSSSDYFARQWITIEDTSPPPPPKSWLDHTHDGLGPLGVGNDECWSGNRMTNHTHDWHDAPGYPWNRHWHCPD